jgi:NADPH2:quinone reductase
MRAIRMSSFGEADVLRPVTVPDPEPDRGQVRVRLHAAGVNPAETYIRSGTYAFFHPQLPYTPGFDGAGVIDAVGAGVTGLQVGDRVFVAALLARGHTGTYAERVVCDAAAVHPLPDALSFAEGAGVGVPCATAYRAVVQRARLLPGETVLVHGASGGVGLPTVQLARALGARVIGTAGTPAGRELVRRHGAHHVLDHHAPGYLDRLTELTLGRGVNVVIEMLANVNLAHDLEHLAKYGRVVVVGSRGALEFAPRLAMVREADILGTALWNATPAEWAQCTAGVAAALEAGYLRPVVGRELPLEQAARAHVDLLAPGTLGKMVLVM